MFGCFTSGYLADHFGRKKDVWLGSCFCFLEAALMAISTNPNFFICARVIGGIGVTFASTIIPPWISELASAHNGCANFALVFFANYLGIIFAYSLDYVVKNTGRQFNWRFPMTFMT
ncbi:hypothetical protein MMC08_007065, partial [Hypocenomyce scalaris]|nr:hypothetical protein [Hypocenomyce scalaris]